VIAIIFSVLSRNRYLLSTWGNALLDVYQLDLITPGNFPWDAMLRKQIRQMPNFLKNPRGLPHSGQRLYART
jgi:hypothetical protein